MYKGERLIIIIIIFIRFQYAVKPLYSGHHRDREKVPAIERCLLIEAHPKSAYFAPKIDIFLQKPGLSTL